MVRLHPLKIGYRKTVAYLTFEVMERYALKELSEAEMLQVDEHVVRCPKCRDHLEEELGWSAAMRSPFMARVRKMIDEKKKAVKRVRMSKLDENIGRPGRQVSQIVAQIESADDDGLRDLLAKTRETLRLMVWLAALGDHGIKDVLPHVRAMARAIQRRDKGEAIKAGNAAVTEFGE